jgi:mono/diheme cytochrome c family protein
MDMNNLIRRACAVAFLAALLSIAVPASASEPVDGKALFKERCGMCHQTIGMGVGLLSRRPGDTSKGLLEERADLSAEYVFTVARVGIGNMPRVPRGEASDPELAAIANYLSRGKP